MKSSRTRDHSQPLQCGQAIDQRLRNSFSQIFRVRIVARVFERQNSNGMSTCLRRDRAFPRLEGPCPGENKRRDGKG